jgi:hypothetical protein
VHIVVMHPGIENRSWDGASGDDTGTPLMIPHRHSLLSGFEFCFMCSHVEKRRVRGLFLMFLKLSLSRAEIRNICPPSNVQSPFHTPITRSRNMQCSRQPTRSKIHPKLPWKTSRSRGGATTMLKPNTPHKILHLQSSGSSPPGRGPSRQVPTRPEAADPRSPVAPRHDTLSSVFDSLTSLRGGFISPSRRARGRTGPRSSSTSLWCRPRCPWRRACRRGRS